MRLALLLCLLAVVVVAGKRHHHHHTEPVKAAPQWTASSFTQAVIMGVSFVDEKNGYIAGGDNGVGANALRSSDGGQTWTNVPVKPTMMLMAVAATSEESAVVAGLGLLSGGSQYTVDGMQFENATETGVSMQQTQDAQIIAGSNATVNGVGLSSDGGATYSFSDVGGDPDTDGARYGSFPSASVGYVSAGTWPPQKKTYGKWVTRNIHLHTSIDAEQYMHLEQPEESEDSGWAAAIFRSTDGFQTWTKVFSADTFYFNQISCPSEDVCFAVGENDDAGFGYRSTDGGDTWSVVLNAPGVSLMSAKALSEDEVFLGGGIMGAFGVNGTVYHSTDGGATFDTTYLPGYYLTGMSFVGSNNGWASAIDSMQQSNVLIYA